MQIYDTFPMLRSLPLPFKKAFTNASKAREMSAQLVNEHKKTRVPGEPRDFIDCYLDELDKVCVCVHLWWDVLGMHYIGMISVIVDIRDFIHLSVYCIFNYTSFFTFTLLLPSSNAHLKLIFKTQIKWTIV